MHRSSSPAPADSRVSDGCPSAEKLLRTSTGQNVEPTFGLVSSLFLLRGFCNGMIEVMDKHFQRELHLAPAQSAWVQFAHYPGYFPMALPAGSLAIRFGYRSVVIAGLLLVAVGGFWFIPATHLAQFVYVAAQAGWFDGNTAGHLALSDQGAAYLASVGFVCFRRTGCSISTVCFGLAAPTWRERTIHR